MATAGRTVLFSAVTVALSMSALILFPMYFLKSFAYAGVATVAFAAAAAIVVAPAAIVLLGDRLDALDIRRLLRRILDRPEPVDKPAGEPVLVPLNEIRHAPRGPDRHRHRRAAGVAGHSVPAHPFGNPDDRVLPKTASTHQVGDQLRNDFASNFNTAVTMVIPDADGISPAGDGALRRRPVPGARRVAGVGARPRPSSAATRSGRPSAPAGMADGSAFLTVRSTTPLFSDASKAQLDRLHAVPEPAGRDVLIAGGAQVNRDSVHAITSRMPLVLAVIGVITFVLLFLLTGSLVLPLKALVLNVLSLSAAFGALVWVFQEGHLNAFGTTPTGTLEANMPVLMFCIAFGISMDYEVFLVARIREYWLASGPATRNGQPARTTTRAWRWGWRAPDGWSPPPR